MDTFIGIDFGTTKTLVAVYDRRKKLAKPVTLGRGTFEMPTSMYLTEDGELLFGDDAEDEGISDLSNLVRGFKMRLGTPGAARAGRKYATARQLSAEFLANVRLKIETEVLHQSVDRAVITVPAIFGPAQRNDLEKAMKQAGFTTVELLPEPVAAGIAYCDQHADLSRQLRFIVVDWGGGTFDVAEIERNRGCELNIVGGNVAGLDTIGGEVFDDKMWEIASNSLSSQGHAPLENQLPEDWGRFRRDLRRAKERLSVRDSVSMRFILQSGSNAKISIERSEFHAKVLRMVRRAGRFVTELLMRSRQDGDPPEFILLVGGTTRIPLVAEEFVKITGFECRKWAEGREAIALGAAVQAFRIFGKSISKESGRLSRNQGNSENGNPENEYRKLLKRFRFDEGISKDEKIFIAKMRKKLGLTIRDARSLEVEVVGMTVRDVLTRASSGDNRKE
jgi:molecular chaperone DnaK